MHNNYHLKESLTLYAFSFCNSIILLPILVKLTEKYILPCYLLNFIIASPSENNLRSSINSHCQNQNSVQNLPQSFCFISNDAIHPFSFEDISLDFQNTVFNICFSSYFINQSVRITFTCFVNCNVGPQFMSSAKKDFRPRNSNTRSLFRMSQRQKSQLGGVDSRNKLQSQNKNP